MSRKPLRVCLVGSQRSGKTTFLAGLEALNTPTQLSRVRVRADGDVRKRLKAFADALRAGQWPPKTSALENYPLEVLVELLGKSAVAVVRLNVLDYPGELIPELGAAGDETLRSIYEHVVESEVLLLLLDPREDVAVTPGTPQAAQQAGRLSGITEAVEEAWRKRHPNDRPRGRMPDVAVVLTKADTLPELSDSKRAEEYVARHLPSLLPMIRSRGAEAAVFPLTAVGGVEQKTTGFPAPRLPIDPRGYDELFDWVVEQRRSRTTRKTRTRVLSVVAAILVVVGLGYFSWTWYQGQAEREIRAVVEDRTRPYPERIGAAMRSADEEVRARSVLLTEEALTHFRQEIESVAPLEALDKLTEQVERFQKSPLPLQFSGEAGELTTRLHDRRRSLMHTAIELKRANDAQDPALLRMMNDFLEVYHDGAWVDQIRGWRDEYHDTDWRRAKDRVKLMPVTDGPTLLAKADALQQYLDRWKARHKDSSELERAGRAVAVGRRLGRRSDHRLLLHESGEFNDSKRWHIVKVKDHRSLGGDAEPWKAEEDTERTKMKRWADKTTVLSWGAGDTLRVEFWVFHGYQPFGREKLFASWEGRGPLQLFDLNGTLELTADPLWAPTFVGAPKITFSLPDLDPKDVACLREFLTPGDKW